MLLEEELGGPAGVGAAATAGGAAAGALAGAGAVAALAGAAAGGWALLSFAPSVASTGLDAAVFLPLSRKSVTYQPDPLS